MVRNSFVLCSYCLSGIYEKVVMKKVVMEKVIMKKVDRYEELL
jgi:hypothetical protein